MRFDFEWDEVNTGKLARRGISPEDAEKVIQNNDSIFETSRANNHRPCATGYTAANRRLIVVYDLIDPTTRPPVIRVTTAYDRPRRKRR